MHLPCDDRSGMTADDLTMFNQCLVKGTTTSFANNAIKFTSAGSDYIDCGNNTNVNFTDKMSITFWVYYNSTVTALSKCTTASTGFSYIAVPNSDRRVYFQFSGNGTTVVYGNTAVVMPNNTWTHVCCVYDGNGAGNSTRCMIYINGVQLSLSFVGTIPASLYQSSASLFVNKYNGVTYGNGTLRDIRMYRSALSSTDCMDIYLNPNKLFIK